MRTWPLPLLALLACSPPPTSGSDRHPPALVEICGNGKDDDGDGKADCDDPACVDPVACPVCGDGVRVEDEICDGEDVGDASCAGLGFAGGVLHCSTECRLVTAACEPAPERCDAPGDEDRDGDADCADRDCAALPACLRFELVQVPEAGLVTEVLPAAVLRVKDGRGVPVSLAEVEMRVPPGAVATPRTTRTNAEGLASIVLRLGRRPGPQLFEAKFGEQVLPFTVAAREPPAGTVHTVLDADREAGTDGSGSALAAHTGAPIDLALAGDGTLYVAEACRVLAVSPEGELAVVAGDAACAELHVVAIALDSDRRLLIADPQAARVIEVDTVTRERRTLVGGGALDADAAQGGPATELELSAPGDLAVVDGALFLVDAGLGRILRVDLAAGTLMGTALRVQEAEPGICLAPVLVRSLEGARLIESRGVLFLAARVCGTETGEVDPAGVPGLVRLDGPGPAYLAGNVDGSPPPGQAPGAYASKLSFDSLFAGGDVDVAGNLLALYGDRFLRIDGVTLEARTIGGSAGFAGELEPLAVARFRAPGAMVLDPQGNAFIADTGNGTVRRVLGMGDDLPTAVDITITRSAGFEMRVAQPTTTSGTGDSEPFHVLVVPRGRRFLASHPLALVLPPDLGAPLDPTTDGTGQYQLPLQAGVVPGTRTVGVGLPGLQGNAVALTSFDVQVNAPDPGSIITIVPPGAQPGSFPAAVTASGLRTSDVVAASNGTLYLAAETGLYELRDGAVHELMEGIGFTTLALDEPGRRIYVGAYARIWCVDLDTGAAQVCVGGGAARGDGGPATEAKLTQVLDVDVGEGGVLWITDDGAVRRVDPLTGIIDTVLARGPMACQVPDLPSYVRNVAEVRGTLWLGLRVCQTSNSNTLAHLQGGKAVLDTSGSSETADGPLETTQFAYISSLGRDAGDHLIVTSLGRVRRVDLDTRMVETIAGRPYDSAVPTEEYVPALGAAIPSPQAAAWDGAGHLWIAAAGGALRLVW